MGWEYEPDGLVVNQVYKLTINSAKLLVPILEREVKKAQKKLDDFRYKYEDGTSNQRMKIWDAEDKLDHLKRLLNNLK